MQYIHIIGPDWLEQNNYFGYNANDGEWYIFTDSQYWDNYDMRGMACVVYNDVLYTFGGAAFDRRDNVTDDEGNGRGGSNRISYHDVTNFDKIHATFEFTLWNKIAQNIPQPGGQWRAIIVRDLIYITPGFDYTNKEDGLCCIGGFQNIQVFDPNTQSMFFYIIPVYIMKNTSYMYI